MLPWNLEVWINFEYVVGLSVWLNQVYDWLSMRLILLWYDSLMCGCYGLLGVALTCRMCPYAVVSPSGFTSSCVSFGIHQRWLLCFLRHPLEMIIVFPSGSIGDSCCVSFEIHHFSGTHLVHSNVDQLPICRCLLFIYLYTLRVLRYHGCAM